MCRMTACVHRNVPRTLTSTTRWNRSGSSSETGVRSSPRAMAALLIRMSTRPSSSTRRSTATSVCALSATSKRKASPRRPSARICSTTLSTSFQPAAFSSSGNVAGSRPVPLTATSAPSRASATAAARPMPRSLPAPVTRATLPSNSLTSPFASSFVVPAVSCAMCLVPVVADAGGMLSRRMIWSHANVGLGAGAARRPDRDRATPAGRAPTPGVPLTIRMDARR